jgi:hypothetical protein
MPRTERQIKADDALTEAILETWRAYYAEEEEPECNADVPAEALKEGVMMGYLVLGTMHSLDENGDSYTRVFSLPRDSDTPMHRLLGLVAHADTRFRAIISE